MPQGQKEGSLKRAEYGKFQANMESASSLDHLNNEKVIHTVIKNQFNPKLEGLSRAMQSSGSKKVLSLN